MIHCLFKNKNLHMRFTSLHSKACQWDVLSNAVSASASHQSAAGQPFESLFLP
jgi:hypothetical protein